MLCFSLRSLRCVSYSKGGPMALQIALTDFHNFDMPHAEKFGDKSDIHFRVYRYYIVSKQRSFLSLRVNLKVSYRKQIAHQQTFGCCFSYCLRSYRMSQNFGDAGAPPTWMGRGSPPWNTLLPPLLPCQIWSL